MGWERQETVYLVVTVLKTKNSYSLRKLEPKNLAPNEFCYAFKVTIDEDEWLKRIEEVSLGKVSPPEIPKPGEMRLIIPKATAELVIDRLAGRKGDRVIYRNVKLK